MDFLKTSVPSLHLLQAAPSLSETILSSSFCWASSAFFDGQSLLMQISWGRFAFLMSMIMGWLQCSQIFSEFFTRAFDGREKVVLQRSEEHTSELQSQFHLLYLLLL